MDFDCFLVRKNGETKDTTSMDSKDMDEAVRALYGEFNNTWEPGDKVVIKQELPTRAEGFIQFLVSFEGVKFHPDEYEAARTYAENTGSGKPYIVLAILVNGVIGVENPGQYVDDIDLVYFLVVDKGQLLTTEPLGAYEGDREIEGNPFK